MVVGEGGGGRVSYIFLGYNVICTTLNTQGHIVVKTLGNIQKVSHYLSTTICTIIVHCTFNFLF